MESFLQLEARGIAHLMKETGTILGLTTTPRPPKAVATSAVVRRDNFRPVISTAEMAAALDG